MWAVPHRVVVFSLRSLVKIALGVIFQIICSTEKLFLSINFMIYFYYILPKFSVKFNNFLYAKQFEIIFSFKFLGISKKVFMI